MASKIFEELIEKELQTIKVEWTVERALEFTLAFGKFKGLSLKEILLAPEGGVKYLRWLSEWTEAKPEQQAAATVLVLEYQRQRKKALAEPPRKRKKKSTV